MEKTWAKTSLPRQNWIVIIFWKQVLKQAVGEVEEKSEIGAIYNKYKNTLDDLINNSNTKSPDHLNSLNWSRLIDKGSYNASKSKNRLPTFLEADCLSGNISITSLEPIPKIWDFQMHQRHNVATFDAKSERTQYKKNQQGREDRKGKRDGKDGKDKRSGEGHQKNKINLVIRENSSFEVNIYHHIIYKC